MWLCPAHYNHEAKRTDLRHLVGPRRSACSLLCLVQPVQGILPDSDPDVPVERLLLSIRTRAGRAGWMSRGFPAESLGVASGRAAWLGTADGGRYHRPRRRWSGQGRPQAGPKDRAVPLRRSTDAVGRRPGGRETGRSVGGCRGPAVAPEVRARSRPDELSGRTGRRDASAVNGVGESGRWVGAHGPVRRSAAGSRDPVSGLGLAGLVRAGRVCGVLWCVGRGSLQAKTIAGVAGDLWDYLVGGANRPTTPGGRRHPHRGGRAAARAMWARLGVRSSTGWGSRRLAAAATR